MPSVVAITAVAKKKAAARQKKNEKDALPELHQHILRAFDKVGGDAYLAEIAYSHPAAFLGLLVKVLPLQLAGEDGGPVRFEKIERVIVHPAT